MFYWNSMKSSCEKDHEHSVRNVQKQVKEWRSQGMTRRMCTSRPSYKSITPAILTYKDKLHLVSYIYFNSISVIVPQYHACPAK